MNNLIDTNRFKAVRSIFYIALVLSVLLPIFHAFGFIPIIEEVFSPPASLVVIVVFTFAAILSLGFSWYTVKRITSKLKGRSEAEVLLELPQMYVIQVTAFESISIWGFVLAILGIHQIVVYIFFAIPIVCFGLFFPTENRVIKLVSEITSDLS